MLSSLVGQVDFNAALVLASAIICACIVITSLIVKRRGRVDVEHEFELEKMKLQSSRDRSMYDAETERGFKYKQIEEKLITSHARVPAE